MTTTPLSRDEAAAITQLLWEKLTTVINCVIQQEATLITELQADPVAAAEIVRMAEGLHLWVTDMAPAENNR